MNSTRQNAFDNPVNQTGNSGRKVVAPVPAAEDLQRIVEASRLAREGQYRQAEQFLLPLLTKKRPPVGAVDLMAKMYTRRGQLQEATAMWRWALELDPGNRLYQQALEECEKRQSSRDGLGRLRYLIGAVCLIALLTAGWWYLGQPLTWQAIVEHKAVANLAQAVQGLANYKLPPSQNQGGKPDEKQAPAQSAVMLLAEAKGSEASASAATAAGNAESRKNGVALIDTMAPAKSRLEVQTVRSILDKDEQLQSLSIEIAVNGGIVSLSGEVPTLYIRYHLEKTVAAIPGVAGVTMRDVRVTQRYIVKQGDTLSKIAGRIGGNTNLTRSLAETNGLRYPYRLEIGDALTLPF